MAKTKTVPCSVSLSPRLHARLVAVAAAHKCSVQTLISECVDLGEIVLEAPRIEVIRGQGNDVVVRVYKDAEGSHLGEGY